MFEGTLHPFKLLSKQVKVDILKRLQVLDPFCSEVSLKENFLTLLTRSSDRSHLEGGKGCEEEFERFAGMHQM